MRRRIGILGGTFNPVHTGHLIVAQDALEALRLDEVRFIPCARPPHKTAPKLAGAAHRLAMLRAALRGHDRFIVDDRELCRGGRSYSVDTLGELRTEMPGTAFYFIIGGDSVPDLARWRDITRLARWCAFVVLARPGWQRLPAPPGVRCRWIRGHACEIASRDIRARCAAGQSIRHLVPVAVFRYIVRHQLYEGRKGHDHRSP